MYIFKKVTQIPRTSSRNPHSAAHSQIVKQLRPQLSVPPSAHPSVCPSLCLALSCLHVSYPCPPAPPITRERGAHEDRSAEQQQQQTKAAAESPTATSRRKSTHKSSVRCFLFFMRRALGRRRISLSASLLPACIFLFLLAALLARLCVCLCVCVCEYVLLLCLSRLVVWPLDKIVCACSLPHHFPLLSLLRALN